MYTGLLVVVILIDSIFLGAHIQSKVNSFKVLINLSLQEDEVNRDRTSWSVRLSGKWIRDETTDNNKVISQEFRFL